MRRAARDGLEEALILLRIRDILWAEYGHWCRHITISSSTPRYTNTLLSRKLLRVLNYRAGLGAYRQTRQHRTVQLESGLGFGVDRTVRGLSFYAFTRGAKMAMG